jgi:hypothetical protein
VFVGDLRTRAQTLLRADAGGASYAAPGYLLVEPAGTLAFARLLAQRFDPARGTLAGPTTLVADSVATPDGVAAYALSANGLLVYQQQQPPPARVWHDRQGTALDSIPHDDGWTFRISHDGTRVVQAGLGLWVRDLRRGVALRLSTTGDPERDVYWGAVWSPDDARLAFINPRLNEPPGEIRVLRADATGGEERFPTPRAAARRSTGRPTAGPSSSSAPPSPTRSCRRSGGSTSRRAPCASGSRCRPRSRAPASRPMDARWRTSPTRPGRARSTCAPSPDRAHRCACPRPVGASRCGAATVASSST